MQEFALFGIFPLFEQVVKEQEQEWPGIVVWLRRAAGNIASEVCKASAIPPPGCVMSVQLGQVARAVQALFLPYKRCYPGKDF